MGSDEQGDPIWLGGADDPAAPCELPPWAAGAVLMGLQEHMVPFRLETDLPRFVWVLVKHEQDIAPRVLTDHLLDGAQVVAQTTVAARAADRGQFFRPDWYERGIANSLEDAALSLAQAAVRQLPTGSFAQWWPRFLAEVSADAHSNG